MDTSNHLMISASDLIKKSAKQICYLRKRQERWKERYKNKPTEKMIEGSEAQIKKSTSELIEMRGV